MVNLASCHVGILYHYLIHQLDIVDDHPETTIEAPTVRISNLSVWHSDIS